jgi:hypothetical protein
MKHMNVRLMQSNEVYFDSQNDRVILIIRENDEIVGLNFMQGDDMEVFSDHFNEIDHELTFYYKSVRLCFPKGLTELEEINTAMWAYLEFKDLKCSHLSK